MFCGNSNAAAYDDRPMHESPGSYERGWARLLWWGVLGEFDALVNVAFEALDSSLKELLLICGDTPENVESLLDAVWLFISLAFSHRARYFNTDTHSEFDGG